MATRLPSKGIRASSGRVRSTGGEDGSRAGVGGRPRLRVSHGTKAREPAKAPQLAPARASSPASLTPAAQPSSPPRVRRGTKPSTTATSQSGQLALAIAGAALEKKASNVEIIDLGGKADYADYLVLMTGGSDRHVRALSDGIQDALLEQKLRPLSVEGTTAGSWILLDFGAVVAHVFLDTARAVYDLEGLWLDAARVPLPSGR